MTTQAQTRLRSVGLAAPHGTRSRYVSGCRCAPCRQANSGYYRTQMRNRIFHGANPFVDAAPVLEHIRKLSRLGVGTRAVADAARITRSTIWRIRNGQRKHIRLHAAERVLAVDLSAASDGACIPAGPTWAKIRHLLHEGFTSVELARRLGYRSHGLQLRPKRITAANAMRVQRLYESVMAGAVPHKRGPRPKGGSS